MVTLIIIINRVGPWQRPEINSWFKYFGKLKILPEAQIIFSKPSQVFFLQYLSIDNRIDYEKLKRRENINFFDDLILYEDELDDNGCSKLSVKIVSL